MGKKSRTIRAIGDYAWALYLQIAPWVLPVFGSLVISSHLTPVHYGWVGGGVALIFLGVAPLILDTFWQKSYADKQKLFLARERRCLGLLAKHLPTLPVSNNINRNSRSFARDQLVRTVVKEIAEHVYQHVDGVRVVFYGLSESGGEEALEPIAFNGRSDAPRTHLKGGERFEEMLNLLEGDKKIHYASGIKDRTYSSYVSASVESYEEEKIYGLLTLDTPLNLKFEDRDGENLEMLANLIAAYFSAAERGKRGGALQNSADPVES